MYSIVMVAAMTAGPEVPDFFFKNKGCHGCYGCGGGGGCVGYGCGGCCGGWSWGCHGCHGSSWGGCHGIATGYGCGGCHGCYGGYALTGCCGGHAVPAAPGGVYVVPPAPNPPVAPPPMKDKDGKEIKKASGSDGPMGTGAVPANRGQVVVYVPANAKLYAEGQATTLGGTERVFQTPDLVEGRDFQYTLKIEYLDGTEMKSATKDVVVRAGHRSVVDFTATSNTVSSSVTVSLPAKAKLFVDGVATPATEGTHTFKTPELTKGKAYVYTFRAEIDRDGKTEIESREVNFKGGDPIVVNFADNAVRTASAK